MANVTADGTAHNIPLLLVPFHGPARQGKGLTATATVSPYLKSLHPRHGNGRWVHGGSRTFTGTATAAGLGTMEAGFEP